MKRFLPAQLLVLLILAAAPFMGVIRDVLFERFAATAVRNLALALSALAVTVFLLAISRIRTRRLLRYAGLAVTAVLLWLEGSVFGDDIASAGFAAQVSVAEKVHLVEYGLLAFLLYRAYRHTANLALFLLPLLWLTCAGVLEESVQLLAETRLGDVQDVFLNSYAGICGLVFSLSVDPPERFAWRLSGRERRRVYDLVGLTVLAVGLFFSAAHLGYEHEDPEIGRFRSWHTLDELRQAKADRTLRWRADPPTELLPWRREDFFLTEASWHANHRNERYRAGDAYLALQADLILEKYYDPFLDLESFRGSSKNRYPPEIRRELEAKAPRFDPRKYESPVLVHRIYLWPTKPLLFAMLIPGVLAIWLVPRIRRRRS